METSRAVRISWFGGPDVLMVDPVSIPQPQDDEVLVRVAAASVNPVDYKIRSGKYPLVKEDDLPVVLGRDLAGTIEAVGTRAHYMLSKGEPVFAFIGFDRGSQSDYVVVKAVELVAAPKSIDLVHAAAIPLAAMTAWQGLFDHGELQPGQRVLIHGGAGGVGHMAVQLAKAKGATVFATCGPDDLDFVRSLGADRAVDYKGERFEDVATGIDLVLDLVAGETQDRSWAVLKPGGKLVCTLSEPDAAQAAEHGARFAPRWWAQPNAVQLGEVAAMVDDGRLRVEIARTFPLEEAAAAHALLEAGGVRGKVVLTLG
jgi:NADPH:quinone reductase-like Zn-dependent oxidoreductase